MRKFLAGLTVATAVGLAACGGGSKSSGVASLAGSGHSTGATTTTLPRGTAAQLYAEWASCMRQHGVQMSDPTINSQGQVSVNASQTDQATFQAAQQACQSFETAGRIALGGPATNQKPDPTKLLNFAKCMRSHGISDFPDPSSNGLRLSGGPNSDLNPSNPTFQRAQTACQHFLGNMRGAMRIQTGGPGGPQGVGSGGAGGK